MDAKVVIDEPLYALNGNGVITEYNEKLYVITSAYIILKLTVSNPMTFISCGIYTSLNIMYHIKIIGIDSTSNNVVFEISPGIHK